MTITAIERIERHTKKIASGKHETVRPGQPFRFSEACTAGDTCWQGDLGLVVIDAITDGFMRVTNPTDKDRQLVPGNTLGAKHILDSLDGVTIYRPKEWSAESLAGPVIVLATERTITHPTHGAISIPSGFTIACRYQREFDSELRRERRSAD